VSPLPEELIADIDASTGIVLDPDSLSPLSGGSINKSCRISDRQGCFYFLKRNTRRYRTMFEAERDGLLELAGTGSIRVPQPVGCGTSGPDAWLLLEYLELGGGQGGSAARLGSALAQQHRHTRDRCGWYRDNTIGSTPQKNPWSKDWAAFFATQRLGYQLGLAENNGYGGPLQEEGAHLLEKLPLFFEDHHPQASLLHGDLWGGNWGVLRGGEPVVFDPAVYYGDRETDIAMTRLFGGFNADFHASYQRAFPLDKGFERRQDLYNLYHVLNHLNLFGSTYLQQSLNLINRLLDTIRAPAK